MRVFPLASLLPAALLLLTGCATNPVTGESDFVLMSEDQELSLGRQAAQSVAKEYPRYEDPELQAYVQRIGRELAGHSHRTDLIYRFTVVDSPEVNAFALPGGYIYVTRGLLAYLETEAELAAVLGHEIGHVTARHAVRQYTARQAANIGYALGGILVPELRTSGSQQIFNLLGTGILRGYGREHELEADRLGAEYLARTGRDPKAMIEVLEVLKNQEALERRRAAREGREPKVYHGLFATHPDNDERLQGVVKAAEHLGRGDRPANREGYLRHLEGLAFGPSAREGVLRGRHFYHRGLGFAVDFPPRWRVKNQPDRLVATAPGGSALVQLTTAELNRRLTPRQFIAQRLRRKDLTHATEFSTGDLPGYTGFAKIGTPWGTRLGRISVVVLGDHAYIFAAASKDPKRPRERDTEVLETVYSMHRLGPTEARLAEERRLHLLRAGPKTRFADLARDSALGSDAEETLRLLNGHYPSGEPRPGELLKVVR